MRIGLAGKISAYKPLLTGPPLLLPQDIIIKFKYFRIKETDLCFQWHKYQLVTDLAPSTVQKRRQIKPYTSVLMGRHIKNV